jgi:alpha-amylase
VFKRLAGLTLAATIWLWGCSAPPALTSAPGTAGDALEAQGGKSGAARWQDEVVYFALLDRFQDGDKRNNFNVDRSKATAYHGGDLQGLIDKLDYLQDLGITSVWISPPLDNDDDQLATTGMWGYHGYWIKDFDKVDEHMGTTEKLKELVQKAHAKGMKVLFDAVANHAGYSFPVSDPRYKGWFHQHGEIKNWDDPWWSENGSMFGLPDFAQENAVVSKFLVDTYLGWADRIGFDGFRLDAVKHVPQSFWRHFNDTSHQRKGAGFLTLGEVLHGDPHVVAAYQRQARFDSLFDFPLYYALKEVFAEGGSMRRLGQAFAADGAYENAAMLSPFLDNHDVPRFLHYAGNDRNKLKLALACVLTIRGIPMLYYGTETALPGGAEPDNRRDMNWGANPDVRTHVQKILAIRKRSGALRRGRQLEMWQDDAIYAYLRQTSESEAIVALNNDWRRQERDMPLRAESRMRDGDTLIDQLTGERVTVQDRRIAVKLEGKQARIFLPAN